MSSKSQALVTLAVRDPRTGEVRNLGYFDQKTGGGTDSNSTTYRAAGGRKISLGGSQNPENVTLQRYYDVPRDHPLIGWLHALAGIGEATITEVPTDVAYVPNGSALTYVGTLKRVGGVDVDSTSDDERKLELEIVITNPPKLA